MNQVQFNNVQIKTALALMIFGLLKQDAVYAQVEEVGQPLTSFASSLSNVFSPEFLSNGGGIIAIIFAITLIIVCLFRGITFFMTSLLKSTSDLIETTKKTSKEL